MELVLIHILFNVFSVVSFLCVFLLFLIYQRVGGNLLLRSCSIMLLFMLTTILIGSALYENNMISGGEAYCKPQAFILNYCVLAVHGLIACMMFDAWSHVCNWRPRKKVETITRYRAFSPGYILCSFVLPMIPTILLIIVTFVMNVSENERLVQAHAYYCYVSTSGQDYHYLAHTAWIILYSAVGVFCSVYLLFKTIWTRQKSKKSGRTTHLTLFSIIRVAMATCIYIMIVIATILPAFFDRCSQMPRDYGYKLNDATKNPFDYMDLCNSQYSIPGKDLYFWSYFRCPRWYREFLPCFMGIGFFLMYGFGKHAKKAYIDIYRRCRDCATIFVCLSGRKKQQYTDAVASIYSTEPPDENINRRTSADLAETTSYEWDGNMRDWYDSNMNSDDVPLDLMDALALPMVWYNYYDEENAGGHVDHDGNDYPEQLHTQDELYDENPLRELPISNELLDLGDLPPHMRLIHPIPKPAPIGADGISLDGSIDSSIDGYRNCFSKSCPY